MKLSTVHTNLKNDYYFNSIDYLEDKLKENKNKLYWIFSDDIEAQISCAINENFINDFLYADADNLLVFFENHDTERFNERHPDIRDYKLALSLICTTRGIPQIYYGSEIGMKGERNFGDGDIRRDFPGGWKDDQHSAFIDSERTDEENAYFEFTKRLLNWRKNKFC